MMDNLPNELTEKQRDQAKKLLQENEAIFSKGEYDIGRRPVVEYRIDTGEHRPIRQPLRRHLFKHLETIDKQVAEMEEHGIIEPTASPWASNVVLVRKKDGSLRFCIDYQQLNRITTQDNYPLPLIDNCLNAIQGSTWLSTLDLRAGYYNIPVAEEDKFDNRQSVRFFGEAWLSWDTSYPKRGLLCRPKTFRPFESSHLARTLSNSELSSAPRDTTEDLSRTFRQ